MLGNDLEYAAWDIDNDGTWDYDIGGDMMHESPDSNNSPDADGHTIDTPQPQRTESEKRKQPPEGDKSLDPHDAEPKRRGAFFPRVLFSLPLHYISCFFCARTRFPYTEISCMRIASLFVVLSCGALVIIGAVMRGDGN